MKYYLLIVSILVCLYHNSLKAQLIKGQIKSFDAKNVKLFKFNGVSQILIDSTIVDDDGLFKLKYSSPYNAMGSILINDAYKSPLVLNGEDIVFTAHLNDSNNLELNFTKGNENKLLTDYMEVYPFIKNSVGALEYLGSLYKKLPHNEAQSKAINLYNKEIKRLQLLETRYNQQIDSTIILKHYLPLKKLLSNLAEIANYKPQEQKNALKQLAKIDYSSDYLFNSGILNESINYHIWFISNIIEDESVEVKKINQLINKILSSVQYDNYKFNEISELLLKTLQKANRSENLIFLKNFLNKTEYACLADRELLQSLKSIKDLSIGAVSPDFKFPKNISNAKTKYRSFAEVKSTYKLLVFAGSWCSHCRRQIPKINKYIKALNKNNVEVVLFSVEQTKSEFNQFTKNLNFISMTDLKGWKSDVVKLFNVKATPTYFIVDRNNQIILKPDNLSGINKWLNNL